MGACTLGDILQKKEERKAALMRSLELAVSRLKAMGAIRIVLFGSLARDDVDIYSDLDLLVVMPSDRTGRQWSRLIYEKVDLGVAHDILVYNESEFEEQLEESSFLADVVSYGRVVYEKTV